ncbi:oligoendopeptidase F [Lacticaseibacillus yichunensis]|uniref:Oligopeptidase F n=1 Tax=Lacticaseibacillus yichunensis TaxID=2486015 RepID=A0ABW4CUZ8_9LACO|nr:oligoendopeptidase F [Lacticaseibacillus yichunensis]
MADQLKRSEAPVALTWNLQDLFETPTDFAAALTELKQLGADLATQAEDFTKDGDHFLKAVRDYFNALVKLTRAYLYAELENAQDTTDATGLQDWADVQTVGTAFDQATAWFSPAVVALDEGTLTQFQSNLPELADYARQLAKIRTLVGHVLPKEQEALLAQLSSSLNSAGAIQETLDDSDLTFGQIDYDGKTQALTKGLMGPISSSAPRDVRRIASKQFQTSYYDHRFTFAKTLNDHMHAQNTIAKIRHYDSARQMDLAANAVPESVYDTLIAQTHAHLDLLHRYYALRKKVLGLDPMYGYDGSVPLTGKKPPIAPTYEEAKATALKALAPLGEDYLAHLRAEFDGRWVDVLETKGKTSGGFENFANGTHPYILLNWADTYGDMSTLVHESGHAMQSVYSDENQLPWNSWYPIFTAEIASTTNESLLNAYMLEQTKDDKEKQIYLLTEAVSDFTGTLYRQAEFAEFEQFMYETEANGTPLTPETLTAKWDKIDAAYAGPAVTPNDWPKAYWAHIPHFFYNYYMYQYATSKAIATSFAHRILTEGEPAAAQYKQFLSAGDSQTPVDVLKNAGIDVTKADYLEEAFATFEAQLSKLEALLS